MNELGAGGSITIAAPIDEVWQAITTPELIKQWFFGVDTESDWKPGSHLIHRGEWQGKPYVDKGEILKIEPPALLVHTHWSEVSGVPDAPENYQEVTPGAEGRGRGGGVRRDRRDRVRERLRRELRPPQALRR